MIAGGTGNSFSLELLGDTNLKLAVDTIIRGIHAPIDVGKVVQIDVNETGNLCNEVCIYIFPSSLCYLFSS
jgi:diacylglycerol kinase family enzyme